jgi:DNA-binding transcriptional regulator YhcF (GntR family)
MNSDTVRATLLRRIYTGTYAVGSRIPPSRTLAKELGVNRNTVGKVFQELARDGIVSLVPGRGGGTFVQRTDIVPDIAADHLRLSLQPLVQQAYARGMHKNIVREVAFQVIDEAYGAPDVRIKFLECNPHDAQELVRQLSPVIDCQIDAGVLDQEDIAGLATRYPLIVTTFHHLNEVLRELNGQREQVVGVHAVPTSEVALRIALLEGKHFGLVCGRENTVASMKYLVQSYHPENDLDVALVQDTTAVQALAQRCTALIATYSCADTVVQLTGRIPDVVVEFQIEAQSIEFLRQRIRQLRGVTAARLADAVA